MPKTETAEAPTVEPRDEEITLTVEHSAYYRWMPVTDEDAAKLAESEADLPESKRTKLVVSTFPGHKLKQVLVNEPTATTTNVHLPSLRQMNGDREAAGLSRRPHHANLAQHLVDGPWPRHFPLDSITDIHCDDPKWEAWLRGHVFEEDEDR